MTRPVAESRARTNRIGRHLPISDGLMKTLQTAREQGLEAVQIFVSNPQRLGYSRRKRAHAHHGGRKIK